MCVEELSERDREKIARRLLGELSRRGGRVHAVSIKTSVAKAFTRARLRAPLTPSGAVKTRV